MDQMLLSMSGLVVEYSFFPFFLFDCARSSLFHGLFSSCGKQGLLSSNVA